MKEKQANISNVPLAVLLGRDGSETVIPLMRLPPPSELLLPRREKMRGTLDEDLSLQPRADHRVFRLDTRFRSTAHRWWEVYNGGRSQTPHDGFVYFEASTPSGTERS